MIEVNGMKQRLLMKNTTRTCPTVSATRKTDDVVLLRDLIQIMIPLMFAAQVLLLTGSVERSVSQLAQCKYRTHVGKKARLTLTTYLASSKEQVKYKK